MTDLYKGVLACPKLLRQGMQRGCRECELFFSTKLAKTFYINCFIISMEFNNLFKLTQLLCLLHFCTIFNVFVTAHLLYAFKELNISKFIHKLQIRQQDKTF
jgi:hypothetical protein